MRGVYQQQAVDARTPFTLKVATGTTWSFKYPGARRAARHCRTPRPGDGMPQSSDMEPSPIQQTGISLPALNRGR
jgi:hypothetical protein